MKNRLNGAKILNDEVAEWLKERIRVEELYANELNKLSKRGLGSSSSNLGTLAEAWTEIVNGLHENSRASEAYARRLRSDIESAIRNYSSKSTQWADLRTTHEGLSALAKQFNESEAALRKAKRKSQAKSGSAHSHLNEVQSQWESQAPMAFEQFEGLDEARLVMLKDALTRYQTLELDKAQSATKAAERCLNALLAFEPQEELNSFVANLVAQGEPAATPSSRTPTGEPGLVGSIPPPSSNGTFAPPNNTNNIRRSTTDSLYDTSQRLAPPRSFTTAEDSSSIKSKDGGAKLRSKVGSIFRSSKSKGKKKEKEKEEERERDRDREIKQQREFDRHRVAQQQYQQPPARASTMPEVKRQSLKPAPPPSRKLNGPSPEAPESVGELAPSETAPKDDFFANGDTGSPISGSFNEPSLKVNIRNEVIAEEDGDDDNVALSQLATKLRARNTQSSRTRGRRDIQSKLFTGIEASDVENQHTAERAAAGVPATSTEGNIQPPVQLMSQLQGFTGDTSAASIGSVGSVPSANQLTAQTPSSPPSAATQPFAVPSSPQQPAPVGVSSPGSHEVQSLNSLKSSTTGGSVPVKHPELPSTTGLASTIVEIVNCTLKDGVPVESSVGGEVALGYNEGANEITPSYTYVRVNNTSSIEKIASNPAFVQAVSPGLFKVFISSGLIGLKTGVVGIKYSREKASLPVVFMPIWRIEERQLSLMLVYRLGDGYQGDQVELSNLNITVPIEGGTASSAQSKPVASFNKELQRITWRFNEPLRIKRGSEERLLCRFVTDGPAREAAGGIKIKFAINNSLPLGPNPITLDYRAKERDPFLAEGESEGSTENLTSNGASTGGWRQVPCMRTVVAGRYSSHSEANVQSK